MKSKAEILKQFEIFSVPTGGIGSWLTATTEDEVFERLGEVDENPLTAVQLNQLLVLGHEAPVSDGFYRYYWMRTPRAHPYDVKAVEGFRTEWMRAASLSSPAIVSSDHLKWGLYRLYIDGLLFFGNVRTAFRQLRGSTYGELERFFTSKRCDTRAIKSRGPSLPLREIAKDDRYLISEMACKSYGDTPESQSDLRQALLESLREQLTAGNMSPKIRTLLEAERVPAAYRTRQSEFIFSADEVLDDTVTSEEELRAKYNGIARKFFNARQAALDNTKFYLSMVNDLDVYVATSMRTRQDFRNMANVCDRIFGETGLRDLNLRYFDPTMSAAGGHEDKGLIECLMVKCAKVLVYCAGDRESYGKDAEAAMALSQGKPVIFYCDQEQRSRFYRDVHPLSRLIDFETGVAVGAMVTDNIAEVSELLQRIFENRMRYFLEQSRPGYLRLKEELTGSVVRLQTNDQLLAETFWNHYHKRPRPVRRDIS